MLRVSSVPRSSCPSPDASSPASPYQTALSRILIFASKSCWSTCHSSPWMPSRPPRLQSLSLGSAPRRLACASTRCSVAPSRSLPTPLRGFQTNAPGLIRIISAMVFPVGLIMVVLTGCGSPHQLLHVLRCGAFASEVHCRELQDCCGQASWGTGLVRCSSWLSSLGVSSVSQ